MRRARVRGGGAQSRRAKGNGMRIRGSVALVTGASNGIGKATALALARRGATVALIARDGEALESAAGEIRDLGGQALPLVCDVANPEAVERTAAIVAGELGAVDILVNAAGAAYWRAFDAISYEEHREMMAVNYWGTFHWIRSLLPGMRQRRCGAIVNVVAGSGKFALAVTSGYSASKFAVAGFSEALRRELQGSGVAVSALFPGSVRTRFWNEERIDTRRLPPLVRFSPKLSPQAVARGVVLAIRLGLAERSLPFFVGFLARVNALWTRLGDLLLWRWFVPLLLMLWILRRLLTL
jgi:short-subunit dehydrogenase